VIILSIFSFGDLTQAAVSQSASLKTRQAKVKINISVPFIVQAPSAKWSDDRFQAGCEEASVLMAMRWIRSQKQVDKNDAEKAILTLSDWQLKKYGSYYDTSADDTAVRLIGGFYDYKKYSVKKNISKQDIIDELKLGHIIIAPMNGQKLKNPNFTQPGPEHHMLIIKGYDEAGDQFITNDPGTRRGADYRYKTTIIIEALRDYPTGKDKKVKEQSKTIIVVSK